MQNYRLYYQKLSWHDPEQVFLALYGNKKYTFWLDNKDYSYMSIANKRIKYSISNHMLSISDHGKTQKLHQNIFAYLQKQLSNSQLSILNSQFSTPFDFTGGFIGYLGYELKSECSPTSTLNSQFSILNSKFPDAYFFFIDKFLAFDHVQKCLYLVALSKNKKEEAKWFSSIKNQLSSSNLTKKQFNNVTIEQSNNSPITFIFSRSRRQYLKDIRACQKYLRKGDVYQICLTNQITTNLKTDWLKLFLELRTANPAPFSTYINFGNFALISSSPEQFLHIDKKGCVTSKPIKGTIRRGNSPEEDLRLAKHLGRKEKDRAENIMIVDLVRNDLGKVCAIGSIKVTKPLEIQTYTTVHQLVSTVKGKLRPGATIIDLLKASFPGGSMTGAPKIRAMEIIKDLEKNPRGIYSGTFGFISLNGTANLAMTIRTIIAGKNQLSLGTGGAILTDSNPQQEYDEMLLKAKPLMEAIRTTTGAKSHHLIY